ncbi:DUF2076 domain-containing protein [Acetobacter persici]|uniref:DUF2076 domain-containing protein n=1 Tax=Acetobacter persici TaxID=1076596 RepID=UPI0039E856DD
MTNEERDLIAKFVARVGGASQSGFGSVPSTQPNLPPIDPEADRFLVQEFQQYPEARYRITQMAVVQEMALVEAQNRIQQLQFQLQQAQQALQQAQAQQKPASGGGFLGGLFGGGQRAPQQGQPQQSAPPGWGGRPAAAPQYQPQPLPYGAQPGMFRSGSGFLGTALSTATGVAGGMLAANALTDLFSGHHGGGADAGWGAGQPSETIINNNYGDGAGADPFAGAGTSADPGFDAGSNDWGGDAGGDSGGDWGGDQEF